MDGMARGRPQSKRAPQAAWGSEMAGGSGSPGSCSLIASQRRQARPDKSDREKHRTGGAAGLSRPAGTVAGGEAVASAAAQQGVLPNRPAGKGEGEESAQDHDSTLPALDGPVKFRWRAGPGLTEGADAVPFGTAGGMAGRGAPECA